MSSGLPTPSRSTVFVGPDVGLLEDGWHVVECNGGPDLDIIQRTDEAPPGDARVGELLAFHTAAILREEHAES